MKQFIIYTDGSFGEANETHGGVVYWDGMTNTPQACLHVYTTLPEFCSMRNVGGEVLAAYTAIYTTIRKIKAYNEESMESYKIILVYDYKGIGLWLTGKWKARKKATIWFANAVKKLLEETPNVSIEYVWVPGHTGHIAGNEYADKVSEYTTKFATNNNIPICCMDDLLKLL